MTAVDRRMADLAAVATEIAATEKSLEDLRDRRDRLALQLSHDDGVPLRKLAPVAGTTDSYLSMPRIEARLLRREKEAS
jgi:hypothetical protein